MTSDSSPALWNILRYTFIGFILGGMVSYTVIMAQQSRVATPVPAPMMMMVPRNRTPPSPGMGDLREGEDGGVLSVFWNKMRGSESNLGGTSEESFPQSAMAPYLDKDNFLPNYRSRCWVSKEPWETSLASLQDNPYLSMSRSKRRSKHYKHVQRLQESDNYVRCLPYIILAGFPKCGTTDLFVKLLEHPSIRSPNQKESHWWTRRRHKERAFHLHGSPKIATFDHYLQNFDVAAHYIKKDVDKNGFHGSVTIDASASTMWDNALWPAFKGNEGLTEPKNITVNSIHQVLPDAKIIVIMRNPVDRLFSDFTYFGEVYDVHRFHEAVVQAVKGIVKCFHEESLRTCAYATGETAQKYGFNMTRIKIGMYVIFIKDWLQLYPREQFFFVRTEDYSAKRTSYLKEAAIFLNLDPYPADVLEKIDKNDVQANTQKPHKEMLPETRSILERFYAPFNEKLATLLNDDKFLWNS